MVHVFPHTVFCPTLKLTSPFPACLTQSAPPGRQPCVPLLSDAALLSLVSSAAAGADLSRLAAAAAALRQLAARHGDDWALSEAGSSLVAALDAVVAARDADRLPCCWREADTDWRLVAQSAAVMLFFTALLEHCCCLLEPAHWDVLLLTVSSWVAGLQVRLLLPSGCADTNWNFKMAGLSRWT